MTTNDSVKIGAALLLIGLAVGLFVIQSRSISGGEHGDEEVSYWYCTKAGKTFELRGEETEGRVKMSRRAATPPADGRPAPRTAADALVTMARSPYTDDWTGVPAMKCPKCGEVFVLETEGTAMSSCSRCRWNPAASSTGASPSPAGE